MATTMSETEKPEIPKQSLVRRISYGLCGICGPRVEIEASNSDHSPVGRPSKSPQPAGSQGSKKVKKRPTNISVQGQSVQESPVVQSPRNLDNINYYHNIPQDSYPSYSGTSQGNYPSTGIHYPPSPGYGSDWGENPQYEFAPPSQATGVFGQGQIPWQAQPKDDGAMIRLFKNVDGRITDHILNFYIAEDGVQYQDDLGNIPETSRKIFEGIIQGWMHLLSKPESRILLLRAIISAQVLRSGMFQKPDNDPKTIAENTCVLLSPFALNSDSRKASRLESMRALVIAAAEMHSTIAAQPTKFEVSWPEPQLALNTETMEAALHSHQVPGRVRATAYPGLLKHDRQYVSLLAKAQVLLY